MDQFTHETSFIIHALLIVVMIGVFYNLMVTTRAYGGIVGRALRLIGVGILFFSIAMIERSLINFSVIQPTLIDSILQDCLNLVGLGFTGFGFSKLAKASKS